MIGNQQDPNMICEVFILAPAGLIDEHVIPASGPAAPRWLRRGPAALCSGPRRDRKDPILTADGVTANVTPSAFNSSVATGRLAPRSPAAIAMCLDKPACLLATDPGVSFAARDECSLLLASFSESWGAYRLGGLLWLGRARRREHQAVEQVIGGQREAIDQTHSLGLAEAQ
jgi:hypothetical protein